MTAWSKEEGDVIRCTVLYCFGLDTAEEHTGQKRVQMEMFYNLGYTEDSGLS